MPENSNASRPVPRANTGSAFLDFLANLSTSLVHVERRFEPFVRPLFDATLRDPVARFTTALFNLQRTNEGLGIGGEKPIPDEELHLQSIISSFEKQMRSVWKSGGLG